MKMATQWRDLIITALEDKKGHQVKWLDVEGLFPWADYFVVASAHSTRHLWALCQAVEELCKSHKIRPVIQGREKETQWVVIDTKGVFAHLFLEAGREYYELEKLWSPPILS